MSGIDWSEVIAADWRRERLLAEIGDVPASPPPVASADSPSRPIAAATGEAHAAIRGVATAQAPLVAAA